MLPSRSKSLSSSSAPRGHALMEGILEKKKTFGSSKFYCSLQDGKLYYGEDKGRENIIDISHAQAVREGKAKFSFEIITSSRTHIFTADSQSSRDTWIASLREMMRISSRKNSTLSYIESANSDEESGASASAPRSSVASHRTSEVKTSKTPPSPFKPGFAASLPVGLSKRTNAPDNPTLNEETQNPRRTSEGKSTSDSAMGSPPKPKPSSESTSVEEEASSGHGNRMAALSQNETNEIKEEDNRASTRSTLSKVVEKKSEQPALPSNSISEENDRGALSDDDGGEKHRLTTHSNSFPAANGTPVTNEIGQSSVYANNADIQKFLHEQDVESEQELSASAETYANKLDIEEFLKKQKVEADRRNSDDTKSRVNGRSSELTSEAELQSPKDAARNKDDTDEELDNVFSRSCNQAEEKYKTEKAKPGETEEEKPCETKEVKPCESKEVKPCESKEVEPPARPVLRRPSQPAPSISSFAPDLPQPKTPAVELEVDFCSRPIPELPHSRLEDNWSSAFTEIRAMFSNSSTRKENSAFTSVFKDQQGCAVDSLKHFLKNI